MVENIRVALNAKYSVEGIKRRYQMECGVKWESKSNTYRTVR